MATRRQLSDAEYQLGLTTDKLKHVSGDLMHEVKNAKEQHQEEVNTLQQQLSSVEKELQQMTVEREGLLKQVAIPGWMPCQGGCHARVDAILGSSARGRSKLVLPTLPLHTTLVRLHAAQACERLC